MRTISSVLSILVIIVLSVVTSADDLKVVTVDWSHDGEYFAITENRNIKIFHYSSTAPDYEATLSDHVVAFDWSPLRNRLAVGLMNGEVIFIDVDTESQTIWDPVPDQDYFPLISSLVWGVNDIVAVSFGDDVNPIVLVDGSTHITTDSIDIPALKPVYALAWSPDGQRLAISGPSGSAIHSVGSSTTLMLTNGSMSSLAWSPNGQQLAGSGIYGWVVWDANVGARLFAEWIERSPIRKFYSHVEWKPDGTLIGLGFSEGEIQIRDGTTYQILETIAARPSLWLSFAWRPNASDILYENPVAGISTAIPITLTPSPTSTATPNATFTPTAIPTPTATPTPAPTQTGGGGQIAYDGGCMRPDGMYALGAFCGLNVSGGDTFYLTTGDDPALASGNRVAVVVNSGGGQFASGECTQSHIPPEG